MFNFYIRLHNPLHLTALTQLKGQMFGQVQDKSIFNSANIVNISLPAQEKGLRALLSYYMLCNKDTRQFSQVKLKKQHAM